jgi:hypothetical protein
MFAFLCRAFLWPGKRLRYDGSPLVLEEAGEDEDWVEAAPPAGQLTPG